MKKETVEILGMMVLVVIIVFVLRGIIRKESQKRIAEKADVSSLYAAKVDSLEDIVSFYQIQNPDWELEIDANVKDFAKDFEKGFGKDSLVKVVIVGTSNGDGSLKWLIRTREN